MTKWPLILVAALFAGCTSHLVPLRPVQRVETWVEDTPATQPAEASTAPATTQAADATQPTTRPGHMAVKLVDPNETTRFIYDASYDNIWKQGISILNDAGFVIDRQDYRLGVLTTKPLPSAQFIEFWKPQHASVTNAMENTVNNQRRSIRLSISKVEGKPEFYEIGIQVLVERESNPSEQIGGPIFVEGSGFGRNSVTLRSDYATPVVEEGRWSIVGHDPDTEAKLLDALFKRI
jgi:hypothetical protein